MSSGPDPQNGSVGDPYVLRCTITEAASRLGISKRAVMRQIQDGTLAAERDGRQWVVMLDSSPRSTESEPEQNQLAGDAPAEQAVDPLAGGLLAERIAPRQGRPQNMIEQAIERVGAQHSIRLRAVSEQFRQHAQPTGTEHASTQERSGSFEQQHETPQQELSSADVAQDAPTAAPPIANAQLEPFGEPAEPTQDDPAEPTTTTEQRWEALFKSKQASPAHSDTLPIVPQADRTMYARQALTTLPTDNPGWRERIDEWWQDLISRYAYRSRLIFAMIGVALLLGALLGGAILLLLYSPSRSGVTGAFLVATAPPLTRAATNVAQAAASAASAAPKAASRSGTPAAPSAALPGVAPISPKLATNAPASIPTSRPASASDLLQRVAAAETALRRGQIVATISNADGTGAWAQTRFDLGDAIRPPALHITSIYTGTAVVQKVERITIGDQSWERSSNGRWSARPDREGIADQVRVFLPHAESIVNANLDEQSDVTQLRWHESDRGSDVTLVVDRTTGTPRELRQATPATGTVRVVTYSLWNTAVDITPPEEH
jgi:excisionase family DNA binding protein